MPENGTKYGNEELNQAHAYAVPTIPREAAAAAAPSAAPVLPMAISPYFMMHFCIQVGGWAGG